jgi:hypothetical protein
MIKNVKTSSLLLILGIFLQLFDMLSKNSKKVQPIAFLILATGNMFDIYENYNTFNKIDLYIPSVLCIMNLMIAFYGL